MKPNNKGRRCHGRQEQKKAKYRCGLSRATTPDPISQLPEESGLISFASFQRNILHTMYTASHIGGEKRGKREREREKKTMSSG